MVNHSKFVDLDPASEDILSVWGKDLTARNLEWYFGAPGGHGNGSFSPGGLRNTRQLIDSLTGNQDLGGSSCHGIKGLQVENSPEENELHSRSPTPSKTVKVSYSPLAPFYQEDLKTL